MHFWQIDFKIGFERVDGAKGYIVQLRSAGGDYIKESPIDQPDVGVRLRIVFTDLKPETEYNADIQIIYPIDPSKPDMIQQPDPLTYRFSTIAKVIIYIYRYSLNSQKIEASNFQIIFFENLMGVKCKRG